MHVCGLVHTLERIGKKNKNKKNRIIKKGVLKNIHMVVTPKENANLRAHIKHDTRNI